ncbi:MAG: hypothetical protein QOG79_6394 [Mycobacterium sp.]|nr:hypothetical protein [Mycobacterium sp.]
MEAVSTSAPRSPFSSGCGGDRRGHQPCHVVRAVEIEVDGLGEATEVGWAAVALHDPLCHTETAVRHHRVAQLTELLGLVDCAENAVIAGHVRADENRLAAELVGECLAFVGGQIRNHHTEAIGMKPTHRRLAQAPSATADNRRRAFKLLYRHGSPLSIVVSN